MSRWIKLSMIAATATLPVVVPQAANAQIYIGPQHPQQAQQPPRGGAWGDRDRDGDGRPNRWDRGPANPNWR